MWTGIFLTALVAITLSIWVIIRGIAAWERQGDDAIQRDDLEYLKTCRSNQALGFAMLWVLGGLVFVCFVGVWICWGA